MYRIGIDLGGTNIAAGIVNEQMNRKDGMLPDWAAYRLVFRL